VLCTNAAWQTRRMVGGNVQLVLVGWKQLRVAECKVEARLEPKAFWLRAAQESPILVSWLAQGQSNLAEGSPEQSGSSARWSRGLVKYTRTVQGSHVSFIV